ncbi:LacI family DNA-binding transcriptional regulator [Ruminococcus sp. 5_1_39BFAA]|uniref:LacI family DNA-binding transcriptional regulator n=1 Tax=Ruminococcus sp. 5_1_39BFAA TaxID=457412 RepID=UPI00356623F0
MASIRDVAQKAGVGVGTVSRVLNNTGYVAADTKKRIEDAISELEYTPNELARNLFRNRTGIVGILIPDLEHPFFSNFVRQTEVELYKLGYKTMVCNTIGISNREKEYLDMLDRNMVDGIITGAHTLDGEEYLKRKKTIVSLDRDFGPEIPMVCSDHLYGGKLAAEVLLKNKCRKILHITGIAPDMAANDRHAIFESIISEHGVDVVDMVMEWNRFDHASYWEIAREAIRKCDGIDGVFAADQPALYYMHLAMEAGRKVPEDLKVLAYDGMDVTKVCYPEVTSICQNIQFLAETCANTVVDLIENRKRVPHKQIISVDFRQGQSTLPVNLDGNI